MPRSYGPAPSFREWSRVGAWAHPWGFPAWAWVLPWRWWRLYLHGGDWLLFRLWWHVGFYIDRAMADAGLLDADGNVKR